MTPDEALSMPLGMRVEFNRYATKWIREQKRK